ncbi:DMT family transporter [Dongshaea marina]|uniref:DMT family transporter n=1 Tax=Dongshaea marina TaxID=2047966 RepID=UPI0019003422|nr:DMT family transporter [Dongshaea marina]
MSIAVQTIPPILATGLRFCVSAPLIIALALYQKQPLLFPVGKRKWMLIIALFYFAIPFSLMIYGEKYISSGLAAIIFATMPIGVMITSSLFLGSRLKPIQIFGLAIAVISLCSILISELDINGSSYLIGTVALAGAVVLHSLMYVKVKKYCADVEVLTYNALPCAIASVVLLGVSILSEHPQLANISIESLLAVIYLGLVAGVGGIVAYFKLNAIATPFTASICFLIFPIVALCLDDLVTGHLISTSSLFMLLPLLGGILLTKSR